MAAVPAADGAIGWTQARRLWSASVPLMLGCAAPPLLALADGLFLAAYARNAFNAVVLAIPLVSLVAATGSSVAAALGNRLGRSPAEAHGAVVGAGLALAAIVGISTLLIGFAARGFLEAGYGLDAPHLAAERRYFATYWLWILPSLPLQVLLACLLQINVSRGMSRQATRIVLAVVALNLVLEPFLVFGLRFGVHGAAISLDIAFAVGLGLAARSVRRSGTGIRDATEILHIAAPMARDAMLVLSSIALYVGADLVLARLAAGVGSAAVSALGVAEAVTAVFVIPTRGICAGFIAVFAADLASRRIERYAPTYWSATALVAIFYGTGAAAMLLFHRPLVMLYGLSGEVAALAGSFLQLYAITLLLSMLPRIAQVAFLGLDRAPAIAGQSALTLTVTCTAAIPLVAHLGALGIAVARIVAAAAVLLVVMPVFLQMLAARARSDRDRQRASDARDAHRLHAREQVSASRSLHL